MESIGVNLQNAETAYQDKGIFNGLFPEIISDDTIINKYTEIIRPLEPVSPDSLIHNICVLKKPTNTWTAISQCEINCGFRFQKQVIDQDGQITWVSVQKEDKAVPCSNMIQSFWEEIDIRLNQTRVTNHAHNAQLTSIIDKLTTSHYYEATIGQLAGVFDDTQNPDIFNNENDGFVLRQNMWCDTDLVNLTGPLYSSISNNSYPIPSDIEISIAMTRNKNEVLIVQNDESKSDTFRIDLMYLEICIPRIIIKAEVQHHIENILKKKPIELLYNRFDLRSFLINSGTISWDSDSLFQGYDIPPLFITFIQSQKRTQGDFKKSVHMFELPGGLDSKGKINLLTSQFCIDSQPFLRYKSSKQNNVASGSLMRDYKDTLNNLFSFQTNDLPNITFGQWKEWAHINVYRTTPVEYNFNYAHQLPSVKLPVVKAGLCTINYTFNEPLPINDLQTLYVVAIRPSIISIDSDRRVKTSYHTN